jgi:fibronectin type III domain protein
MKIPSRAGISAGPPDERSPRRRRRAVVAALVAAGLAGSALALPGIAAAAVPTFPDNVVVFPDRDFVTIEGYQDHVGQTATIEVWRGTQIVGSAQGVVEAGDVAFEVNHPGGYCWGAGTNLKVTPDIKPGDRVSIRFGTAANADADDSTTVADAFVNADSVLDEATRTLTVTGVFNGGLNPAQVEQRIVNPELTATDVARRDVRAVPGGLVAAPKGGYSSNLEVTGNTFKATYVFTTLETARIAASGGGERFMSWQVEDAEANRQGLTIAEYGELGGPGMGGCPAGPADVGAPAGTAQVIRSADGLSAQVSWTPQTAVPDASPVSGYSVLAIDTTVTPAAQAGVRTDAAAKQATIGSLTNGKIYTFEVRSLAQDGSISKPFTIGTAGGGTQTPGAEAGITLTPAGGTTTETAVAAGLVTAAGSPAGGQVWFTDDGTAAVTGDALAETAKLYTAPVPVTAPVHLSFAYFNTDGNVAQSSGFYKPGASQPAPAVPQNVVSSALAADRVTLSWAPVTGATAYQVEATPAAAAPIAATTATSQVVTGLAPSTAYTLTVKAKNAEGTLSGPSAPVSVTTTATTDRVTIGTARWKAGDFRVGGTGSVNGNTVQIYRANADGTISTQTIGTPTAIAANAFDIRLRNGAAPATNPGRIFIKSSGGGVVGPFTVTNG